MMLRKFRNQDIAVIEYEGYSEKGPLIKQQVSENAEVENVLNIPAEDPISISKLLELKMHHYSKFSFLRGATSGGPRSSTVSV